IALGSTATYKKAFAIIQNQVDSDDGEGHVAMDLATMDQPIFNVLKTSKSSITVTKNKMVDASFDVSTDFLDFYTAVSMFGTLSSVTLDKDENIDLPKSLSACGELETWDIAKDFQEDDVTGDIKLSLDNNYTKNVDDLSVFAAVAVIKADLIKKGYHEVSVNDLINAE
ncbi:MAG TPA: hypothetical protein VIJ25_19890, partial [Methylococcales bacterium]